MANHGKLYDWIERLPEDGRYTFSRSEVELVTEASPAAVEATLRRLKKRGRIVCPRRGYYVLVPPEYRAAGCPPATWFIDDLMGHLERNYYVALLSAAALHGAGHQQPMAFQVLADAIERNIVVGRVRIDFHASRLTVAAATTTMQTETGKMVVATPETTAFDLVRFPGASGYWSNIATVLSELAECIEPARLAEGALRVARSDVQRLGWLFEFIGEDKLAVTLAETLRGKRLVPILLTTAHHSPSAPLNTRWCVRVNDEVEPDL